MPTRRTILKIAAGGGAVLAGATAWRAWDQLMESGEASEGLRWLRDEIKPSYWDSREAIIAILRYLGGLQSEHWKQDAEAAQLLAGTVENDHV